jgi:hypothetical protein
MENVTVPAIYGSHVGEKARVGPDNFWWFKDMGR